MAEPSERERTLELLNDEVSDRIGRHRASSERIDTKALVVLGFAATAAQFVAAHPSVVWLTAPAYVAYAVAFAYGFLAFLPRKFSEAPEPPALVEKWKDRTRADVLGALVGTKAHTYSENKKIVDKKVRYFGVSVRALVLALILSSISLGFGRSLDARSAGCSPSGGPAAASASPSSRGAHRPGPPRPRHGECEAGDRGDPNDRGGTAP